MRRAQSPKGVETLKTLRGLASIALATALIGAVTAAAGGRPSASRPHFTATALTPDSTEVGTKAPSAAIAETDPSLLGRTDSSPLNVMIKYDLDPTASYTGGVAGLAATSPTLTGEAGGGNKRAAQAYEQHTHKTTHESSAGVRQ